MRTAAANSTRTAWLVILASSAIAWCLLCGSAAAQNLPGAQQNPGALTPAPAEITPEDQSGIRQRREGPLETIELETPVSQPVVAQPAMRFYVSDIRIQGMTLFSPEEMDPLLAPYENRVVDLSELQEAVQTVQREYHQRGFASSQAFLPPQDIVNGQVLIQVAEGRIGQIRIEGNKHYRSRIVARTLWQDPGELFNLKTLEKDLNRSNRLNRFKLKATLAPGELPGETDLKIQVAEPTPIQISALYNNQGRPFIGIRRWGSEFNHYSLTGNNDRLTVQWQGAEGTRVIVGSYALPLNRYGTELGINAAMSDVDVDLGIPQQPSITGKALNYGITLSQPLDRDRVWTVDTGFNWRRVQSFFEEDITSHTDIRSVQAGLNFDKPDRWGRTFSRVQMTLNPWWMDTNTKFWKAEGYFTRLFTLPKNNMLILRAMGQYTREPLPAAEQFQIGGSFNVRGYSEGLLLGDRGYMASIEHRWPIPFLGKVSSKLADRLQGAFFFDIGQIWVDEKSPTFIQGRSNTPEVSLLAGAGVGLRGRITDHLQGFVDLAWGLLDRQEVEPLGQQPTARLHFGVRANMFAEDYKIRGKETTTLRADARENPHSPARDASGSVAQTAHSSHSLLHRWFGHATGGSGTQTTDPAP